MIRSPSVDASQKSLRMLLEAGKQLKPTMIPLPDSFHASRGWPLSQWATRVAPASVVIP